MTQDTNYLPQRSNQFIINAVIVVGKTMPHHLQSIKERGTCVYQSSRDTINFKSFLERLSLEEEVPWGDGINPALLKYVFTLLYVYNGVPQCMYVCM